MRYLFEKESLDVLAQVARAKRSLLAFDFDGTLAPLVEGPGDAWMRGSTGELFARACELFPTAVISGRRREDVAMRMAGARPKYVIGNHGLEPEGAALTPTKVLDEARFVLAHLARVIPGLELEDKQFSLSMHYKHAPRQSEARTAIWTALESLETPLRVVPGIKVFNVLPLEGPTKGDALLALVASEAAERSLYAGDDVTDEDVFRLPPSDRLVSVRVGEAADSAATFFLREQGEIDELLRHLIALRERR